jgi:glycosyltransferase involved in cell wall biosynthesis
MRVVQVPFGFHPDPAGGTEVHVAALARHLAAAGVETLVAAPGPAARYEHEGVPVWRFPVGPGTGDARDVYDEGDPAAAAAFGELLDRVQPDLVHLHALTRAVSLRLVRETARRGVPVVFTYHTPTVSCQRGTLLRDGREVCDGTMASTRCSACTLQGLGLGKVASALLGHAPLALGRALERSGLSGGAWTGLRMPALVARRHQVVRAFLAEVDRIVVPCGWARDVLLRNGVAPARIVHSPQGLADGAAAVIRRPERRHAPLRVVYLGRLDPVKGVDVLVRAARLAPDLAVELAVYGIVHDAHYRARLDSLAAGDPRIRFQAPVPPSQASATIAQHDLLAVPSQCLETGPLVVLEAFAAGVPVLGSALGGLAELVRPGIDGLLVEPSSAAAWSGALRRLAGDRDLLDGLRAGIRPPRTMRAVAREMAALYDAVLGARRPARAPERAHAPA